MNPTIAQLLEKYGVPSVIALALMALIWQMNNAAAAERASHTVLLIEQMSALRHACDPKAP